MTAGRHTEALKIYLQLGQKDPNDVAVQFRIARAALEAKDRGAGVAAITKMIALRADLREDAGVKKVYAALLAIPERGEPLPGRSTQRRPGQDLNPTIARISGLLDQAAKATTPEEKKTLCDSAESALSHYLACPWEENLDLWRLGAVLAILSNDAHKAGCCAEAIASIPGHQNDPRIVALLPQLINLQFFSKVMPDPNTRARRLAKKIENGEDKWENMHGYGLTVNEDRWHNITTANANDLVWIMYMASGENGFTDSFTVESCAERLISVLGQGKDTISVQPHDPKGKKGRLLARMAIIREPNRHRHAEEAWNLCLKFVETADPREKANELADAAQIMYAGCINYRRNDDADLLKFAVTLPIGRPPIEAYNRLGRKYRYSESEWQRKLALEYYLKGGNIDA
jgi:hypothetical protein